MSKITRSPADPARVRAAIAASPLSQVDIGRRLDVTDVAVSLWSRGIRRPAASRLGALAAVLDTTVDYLIGKDVPLDG